CLEVSGTHRVTKHVVRLSRLGGRGREVSAVLVAIPAHRELAGQARRGYAGHAANGFERAVEELRGAGHVVVAMRRRLDLDCEHLRRVEAEWYGKEPLDAA